jgi:uncharacterized protein DUF1275
LTSEYERVLTGILCALILVTGMVDAVSVLGLGRVFTANMSGNVGFLVLRARYAGTVRGALRGGPGGLLALYPSELRGQPMKSHSVLPLTSDPGQASPLRTGPWQILTTSNPTPR